MWKLIFTCSGDQFDSVELDTQYLTIGRSPEATITINDPELDDIHSEVLKDSEGYVFRDRSDKCPTFFNGNIVQGTVRLADGDTLQVGNCVVTVEAPVTHHMPSPTRNPEYDYDDSALGIVDYDDGVLTGPAGRIVRIVTALGIVGILVFVLMLGMGVFDKEPGNVSGPNFNINAPDGQQTGLISPKKAHCDANRRQIDAAKHVWAIENNTMGDGASEPYMEDLEPYLGTTPECPYGGEYIPGRTGEKTYCTHCGE